MKNYEEKELTQELDFEEMKVFNGGGLILFLASSTAFAILWDTINDIDGSIAAAKKGRDRALNMF